VDPHLLKVRVRIEVSAMPGGQVIEDEHLAITSQEHVDQV
jgi:hypothetical protein